MLRVAKRRLSGEVNPIPLGDATHLLFSDESFDVVTSIFTLEILDQGELVRTLREVLRVLRGDGEFLTISIHDRPCRSIKLYKLLSKLSPTIFNCKPIKPDKLLNQAGFWIIRKHETRLYKLPIIIAVASEG